MPYNSAAVEWSDAHFDQTYEALWWPTGIPVLRLWGANDRIVSQRAWSAAGFNWPNVMVREIPGAGHFPWIEDPAAVREAFREIALAVLAPR
ncbi:alpha/beta fold hydrolase [Lysobacter sp. S4-A87]|uniref:alpha/beta fold hydrolase n=1 Tax=Lysobacter sp. S4-A87 TaxID=2925843 RepID=UPI0031F31C62